MTELLVATRKGLFVLRGDPHAGRPFEIVTRAFPGDVVEFAMRDPRTGRYFAGHTSGFYGPRLMFTDDLAGEWTQAEGPAFPEDGETTLERIWMIRPFGEPERFPQEHCRAVSRTAPSEGVVSDLVGERATEAVVGVQVPDHPAPAVVEDERWKGGPARRPV